MIDEAHLVPFTTSPLPVKADRWLVCAPHADDESFGMGGTLALASAAGIATHLVVMTDGALGGAMPDLIARRRDETARAAAVLGIASIVHLDYPDRALPVSADAVSTLAALIARLQPGAVFFPGVQEFHPDHRRCALLVWQALQQYRQIAAVSYEISCQSPANCLVDISQVIEQKKRAIAAYESQLGENSYLDVVLALNRLRTFTLPADVAMAEAFYCYSAQERASSLMDWIAGRGRDMLRDECQP